MLLWDSLIVYLTNIVWPQPAAKSCTTIIHLLPSNETGERIRTVKVRKPIGWVKDGGVSKIKATSSGNAKQIINLSLPIDRQVFSHPQESQAPSCVTATWENNANILFWMPVFLLLLFLPALYAEHDAKWCGISIWLVGVSCSSCLPSQVLVHPQPTCWWVRSSNSIGTVQAPLSNNENIPVSATPFSGQIKNVTPYQLLWSKWTLSLPKPMLQHKIEITSLLSTW